jgi:hypothetical protein
LDTRAPRFSGILRFHVAYLRGSLDLAADSNGIMSRDGRGERRRHRRQLD